MRRFALTAVLLTAACNVADTTERLDELAGRIRISHEAPGTIVAVRRGNELRTGAAGVADLDSGRPLRAEVPFYLGSISKVFTAALALDLHDAGELDLEAPLGDFFPAFPNADKISIRRLLDHTSGLADVAVWAYFRPGREEMIEMVTRKWTRDELLERAGALPPDFAPGEGWAYSNTNYIVLAAVIEEAASRSFAEALRERILTPLELEETWLDQYEPPRGKLAATGYLGRVAFWPHSEMFGELGPTTPLDKGNMEWGAGGMVATLADVTRFLQALLHGEVLSAESTTAMQNWIETPPLGAPGSDTPPDRQSGYGLGLARGVRDGYTMIGHGGLYNGHTAGAWHVPECSAVVAFYVNRGFVDARAIMDTLVAELDCGTTITPQG